MSKKLISENEILSNKKDIFDCRGYWKAGTLFVSSGSSTRKHELIDLYALTSKGLKSHKKIEVEVCELDDLFTRTGDVLSKGLLAVKRNDIFILKKPILGLDVGTRFGTSTTTKNATDEVLFHLLDENNEKTAKVFKLKLEDVEKYFNRSIEKAVDRRYKKGQLFVLKKSINIKNDRGELVRIEKGIRAAICDVTLNCNSVIVSKLMNGDFAVLKIKPYAFKEYFEPTEPVQDPKLFNYSAKVFGSGYNSKNEKYYDFFMSFEGHNVADVGNSNGATRPYIMLFKEVKQKNRFDEIVEEYSLIINQPFSVTKRHVIDYIATGCNNGFINFVEYFYVLSDVRDKIAE